MIVLNIRIIYNTLRQFNLMFQLSDICHAKTTCSHQCISFVVEIKSSKTRELLWKRGEDQRHLCGHLLMNTKKPGNTKEAKTFTPKKY